jgi:tetratricopeptide (TPR) repeat protein
MILAFAGYVDEALTANQNMTDREEGSKALLNGARLLIDIGKANEAVKYLNDAFLWISDRADTLKSRSEEIAGLAEVMAREGKSSEMVASLSKIENPSVRAHYLAYAARGISNAGKSLEANQALDAALASAHAIGIKTGGFSEFIIVTNEMVEAGRIEEAKRPANEILAAIPKDKPFFEIDIFTYILIKIGKNYEARKLLATALKSALVFSNDRYVHYCTSLAKGMVYAGMTKEALAFARSITPSYNQKNFRDGIVEGLVNIGRVDEAITLMQNTIDVHILASKKKVFLSIFKILVAEEGAEKALIAIDKILGTPGSNLAGWRASWVCYVIKQLLIQGKSEEALEIFCSRSDIRATSPICLSTTLVKLEKINEAWAAAHNIKNDQKRSIALAEVATALFQTGKNEEAQKVLDEALSAVDIKGDPFWFDILQTIIDRLMEANRFENALSVAYGVSNEEARLKALTLIASKLVKADNVDEAKRVLSEVLSGFDKIKDANARSGVIPLAVVLMAKAGMTDEANRSIEQALVVTPEKQRESLQHEVRIAAIIGLANAGKFDEAKVAFQQVTNERRDAFPQNYKEVDSEGSFTSDLAVAFARGGDIGEAVKITSHAEGDLKGYGIQSRIIADVAERITHIGKVDEAMKIAETINNVDYQSSIIFRIVNQLVKDSRPYEALAVAGEIKNAGVRSTAFAAIAQKFALSRSFRLARLTADNCSTPSDKLSVYADILLENARAKDPKLMAKLVASKAMSKDNKGFEDEDD